MSEGRLESLTDRIFATVMTVLILSLSVPVITGSQQVSSELIKDVENLLPDVLSYVISFVILGFYWVRHHNMFHFQRIRQDHALGQHALPLDHRSFLSQPR